MTNPPPPSQQSGVARCREIPRRLGPAEAQALVEQIKAWAVELGFQQAGIADIGLAQEEERLWAWLEAGMHGEMGYLARHGIKRSRPAELIPGTLRVISVRMDYRPPEEGPERVLQDRSKGYISRYALGRDYHKLMRRRLQALATRIEQQVGSLGYRVFVDSAPVLEKPLAARAGLGWQGKHTNLVSRDGGGWFFLGEIYIDLELPVDSPQGDHCGRCEACLACCPTAAIIAPYRLDARRCIAYLTIEHRGPIPLALRPLMGNRIFGCDDCLLACPWNRFASPTECSDFLPRHGLESPTLVSLFQWDEATFLRKTEGSPVRRIGHRRWLRNIAVALGNGTGGAEVMRLLSAVPEDDSEERVGEHARWALQRLEGVRDGR